MGLLPGFSKRKKITLTGGASGAQTNLQLKLTVAYAAAMQGDFDDLRITQADGETLVDAWLESKIDDTSAVVWAEFPTTPANTVTQDYYLYYGSTSASSIWNFDNTFIGGDPFDNATLDTGRWPSVDGTPVYSIDATNHYLEVTDMAESNWQNGKGFHSKALTYPTEWIIDDAYSGNGFRQYQSSSVDAMLMEDRFSVHHTAWSVGDQGVAFTCLYDAHSNDAYVRYLAGVGGNADYDSGKLSTPHSLLTKIWKTAGNIHIEVDSTERVNEANAETPNIVHLGISRLTTYEFGTARFYAFKIRKYASGPPTYAFGSEEALAPGILLRNPAMTGGMV